MCTLASNYVELAKKEISDRIYPYSRANVSLLYYTYTVLNTMCVCVKGDTGWLCSFS